MRAPLSQWPRKKSPNHTHFKIIINKSLASQSSKSEFTIIAAFNIIYFSPLNCRYSMTKSSMRLNLSLTKQIYELYLRTCKLKINYIENARGQIKPKLRFCALL